MKHNKISDRFFMLLIIVLIPILVFEIFSIRNDKKQIVESKLESSVYLSEAISNSFEKYIDNLWTQQDIISIYMLSNPSLPTQKINHYLKQVVDKQETIQDLFWLDADGIITAGSNPNMIGESLRYKEYIMRIREGEDRILSDLVNGFTTDDPILPIAKAIKQDGKLVAIMIASINPEKIVSQFSSLLFEEGEHFTLVDRNGVIVYRNDTSCIYKDRKKIDADSPTWGALDGVIIKTERKFSENNGLYILGCSYPIGKTGWALSVGSIYDNVIKNVHEKTNKAIILFLIMLFFSFLIALLIGDHFVAPIIKLKDAAYNIMHGDYSVRTNIIGNDEIAITAQTFDIMAESIQKNDKQKTQFFANLSHELKTPLNVILASIQLVDKIHSTSELCPKYPKIYEQLFLMKKNCYSLIRMVSNLIDLSKHDNGYLKLKFGNYNIISIIEDITMSIVKYADTKKIEVLFDTDTEEKTISCNPDAIERIMLNLISNSLKFTEEGGSIFVNIFYKEDHIFISVKDTGIGIPEDNLDFIFERFKQVDNSLSRNNEGSGIGLCLVKALVETHGGNIKVSSVLNEGTEFIIELPVTLLEEDTAENDESKKLHDKIVEKINLEFSDLYQFKEVSK